MLNDIVKSYKDLITKYSQDNPWTSIYGLARSMMAVSLLITFWFSDSIVLFKDYDLVDSTQLNMLEQFSFFYLLSNNLVWAKIISILVLFSVISGYFPQVTSVLHWWIAFSFISSSTVLEGGDQLNSIMTFLLIPIAVTDNRICHWHRSIYSDAPRLKMIAWSCYLIITLQVSIVYFHAATAKFAVEEWVNGTAVYYWSTHHFFGVNESLRNILFYVTSKKVIVVFITWGTLLLEIILFAWVFMKRNTWNWKLLLIFAIGFHFGIIILHSLVSFFFSMIGALILYLIPKNLKFKKL